MRSDTRNQRCAGSVQYDDVIGNEVECALETNLQDHGAREDWRHFKRERVSAAHCTVERAVCRRGTTPCTATLCVLSGQGQPSKQVVAKHRN
jgi:hypothetical protein